MIVKEEDYISDWFKLLKLKGSENYQEWLFKVKWCFVPTIEGL